MSYIVTVPRDADAPNWCPNAAKNAWDKRKPNMSDMIEKKEYSLSHYWALEYNSTIDIDDTGRWAVTFPTEQDYTMFLLRWS